MTLHRELFLPKPSVRVADKQSDAVAYIYTSHTGKPGAAIFIGKQAKPISHYSYRDDAKREAAIAEAFKLRREAMARKIEARGAATSWVHDYKVGELLYTSWGYDQTNIDFYQITDVRGKHVILRKVSGASVDTGNMTGKSVPQQDAFIGEPKRYLAQKHGIRIASYANAYRWAEKTVAGVQIGPALSFSSYH